MSGGDNSSTGRVQSQAGQAAGLLPDIDAVILFPSLGAPCVVKSGAGAHLEVLVAVPSDAHLNYGNITHYLRYRPFQADWTDREDALQSWEFDQAFMTQQSWPLSRFKDGITEETPGHMGADGVMAQLPSPIFPVTTCRLHEIVVDKLKDSHPNVYRVLLKVDGVRGLSPGTMYELVWLSHNPHEGIANQLVTIASGTRGRHLPSDVYHTGMHMRHPFMAAAAVPTRFAHFTDIHNSTAHNLLALSNCRVFETGEDRDARPVSAALNNYNRNFSHLCDKALSGDAAADAYVLTGDLLDYGRGIRYPDGDPKAAWMRDVGRADAGPATAALAAARLQLSQKSIWDDLGADSQLQYYWDANFEYFIKDKIIPRYAAGRPVFTSLGNHDFHPNPFTPWPTFWSTESEDSFNPFTPSDYNLTRYEALLAYGPNSYDSYAFNVLASGVGATGAIGGGAIDSRDECCAIYLFFVNPFCDYAVRLGDHSLLMLDFGRKESRPKGKLMIAVVVAIIEIVLVALLIFGGIELFLMLMNGTPSTGEIIGITILIVVMLLLAVLLAIAAANAIKTVVDGGMFQHEFEAPEDLPGATAALSSKQQALLDRWAALPGETGSGALAGKALFCHALILGRAPKLVSVSQLNASPAGSDARKLEKMVYGTLADGIDKIMGHLDGGRITVTMSGHSHYSSVYEIENPQILKSAWSPGRDEQAGRTRKIACVTRASGPVAELNLTQPDPLDDQSSLYINRQLRDKPGGTLLRLEGGQATITPILADLPSATPRRAAFDSWKNRIKQFTGGMNDALDEQAPFELRYLSDINPETSVEHPDPMRWPTGLTNVKLLFEGQAAPRQFALTGGGRYASDAPANLWQSICVFFQKHFSWLPFINSYDPWSYEMFAFNTEADDYLKLRRMADRTARIPCTVTYPAGAGDGASAEFDQSDPWRFEVTVELSGAWGTLRDIPILGALGKALSPTYSGLKVIRTEFPEFGKRIERMSYSHPFGAEPGQAPAGPNPPGTVPPNPGPTIPAPQNPG